MVIDLVPLYFGYEDDREIDKIVRHSGGEDEMVI